MTTKIHAVFAVASSLVVVDSLRVLFLHAMTKVDEYFEEWNRNKNLPMDQPSTRHYSAKRDHHWCEKPKTSKETKNMWYPDR